MSLLSDVQMGIRYTQGLRDFHRTPIDLSDPAAAVRGMLRNRQETFVAVMRRAIWTNAASPYRALFRYAGIEQEAFESLVKREGIEAALRQAFEAGVHVTLDEFKGRAPIRRGSLELPASAAAFDNPLARQDVTSQSGGSRSSGTRLVVDLRDILNELPARYLFLQAHGLLSRPYAIWAPAPPALGSIKNATAALKLGIDMVRWYSPTRPVWSRASGKSSVVAIATILGSQLAGRRMPWPEYVPIQKAETVARWLARHTERGIAMHMGMGVSRTMRTCHEARRLGLDISGHTLRASAEPLTEAKAQIIRDAGCRYCSNYTMTESGRLGVSCGDGQAPDDMHLLTYRMAMLQEPRALPGWTDPVGALYVTVFAEHMTKVMLNVETGDYGELAERRCNCPLDAAGLHLHLQRIRSYEKLTSVGMHFMGIDLIELIETTLPERYGGGPTDYQFVEEEVDGETRVNLVIRPAVGELDEDRVQAFVLDELERRTKAGRLMTDIWRDHNTMRIVRREPYVTSAAKIQTLHALKKR